MVETLTQVAATQALVSTLAQVENTIATVPSNASSNTPFTLTINSPADQAVVSQPSVEIRGEVSTDMVLSINDDIYIFPAGIFTVTVSLQEGPNVIQIVASDMSGNEIDQILTITYQP
jgi:archaellum component FlaF (FlaF/FlaG flagellin family)